MNEGTSSMFQVLIDFDSSHTFFPIIILWLLAILVVMIAATHGRALLRDVKSGKRRLALLEQNFDRLRLFGSLALMVVYFVSMDMVGRLFPNMGFGFLFMSIPFMLCTSLLYVHDINRKKLILIGLNSLIAPGVAWYVLGYLFNITLP